MKTLTLEITLPAQVTDKMTRVLAVALISVCEMYAGKVYGWHIKTAKKKRHVSPKAH